MKSIAVLGVCVLLAGCASNPEAEAAASALMDADRAFAADAEARGVHAAFTSVVAPDAVIFRPEAVIARVWLEQHPEFAPPLSWSPDGAEVAGSVDLGVTTGAWGLSQDGDWTGGRYVTVWRRAGETWEVVLDHGVSLPAEQAELRAPVTRAPGGDLPATLGAVPSEIVTVDMLFARALAVRGEVFEDLLDPSVEFLREGQLLSGLATANEAYAALATPDSTVRCQGAVIARDATIAATWGLATSGEQRFAYVRIWRSRPADGQLRVRLDVLTVLPPTPSQ